MARVNTLDELTSTWRSTVVHEVAAMSLTTHQERVYIGGQNASIILHATTRTSDQTDQQLPSHVLLCLGINELSSKSEENGN